jgi:hypothetical protein
MPRECVLASFHQEGQQYPEKTPLVGKYPIPCAGSFNDYEEQFEAWVTRKRCAIHLRKNCALSLAVKEVKRISAVTCASADVFLAIMPWLLPKLSNTIPCLRLLFATKCCGGERGEYSSRADCGF